MRSTGSCIVILALTAACGSSLKSSGEGDDTDTGGDPRPEIVVDLGIDTSMPPDVVDAIPEPSMDTATDIWVDTAPPTGITGEPCIEDGECVGVPGSGRFCLDFIDFGSGWVLNFPGGYCSAECGDGSECGAGNDCVDFSSLGLCFKRCTSSTECRESEGYTCYSIPFVTTETYCVPHW